MITTKIDFWSMTEWEADLQGNDWLQNSAKCKAFLSSVSIHSPNEAFWCCQPQSQVLGLKRIGDLNQVIRREQERVSMGTEMT